MKANSSVPASRRAISREQLLEGPVLPLLLRLAAPTLVVIAAQTLVAVAETYWIAQLGTSALAGAALVVPMVVLMATVSNGGIGGGVSSAIARAIGAGDRAAANRLLWHAIILAIVIGAMFSLAVIGAGPAIYAALGAKGAALEAALTYSNWTFAGAIPLWTVNLIAAALRGAGDAARPARVTLVGAIITAALTPALVLGAGPMPRLGLAGAGAAIGLYYVGALIVLVRHLRGGRGVLTLTSMPLERATFAAIFRVGLPAAFTALLSNITIIAVTGAVGLAGSHALAGYGVASRLDSLLVPPLFAIGTAVITMAGAATGAGRHERARRVGKTAAIFAALVAQTFGLLVALYPHLWTGLFTSDPAVAVVGAAYLRTVAPFYGALALGLLLYFAAQGTGRLTWAVRAGVARLAVAAGGGWLAATTGAGLDWVFAAVAAGALVYGALNGVGHAYGGREPNLDFRYSSLEAAGRNTTRIRGGRVCRAFILDIPRILAASRNQTGALRRLGVSDAPERRPTRRRGRSFRCPPTTDFICRAWEVLRAHLLNARRRTPRRRATAGGARERKALEKQEGRRP